jgi:hypothetical protein
MNDIENVNHMLILRVSRKYKNKIKKYNSDMIYDFFYDFIKEKTNIENIIVKDFKIFEYPFYYRQNEIPRLIKLIEKKCNQIKLINTTDLGKLLEDLV